MYRPARTLAFGTWLTVAALAPTAPYAEPTGGTARGPETSARVRPTADTVRRALDAAWQHRVAATATARLRTLAAEARTHARHDYGVGWRRARALWWLAHVEHRGDRRATLARKAAAAAEQAIVLHPDGVEGHFAYAAAIGEYGASIGAMQAVWEGVAPKFERAALAAYARDRDFEGGAPMLALGRYYFALPWPLRDLERSRRYLEELTARHPDALLGRVWLAETLLALGDREVAHALLESVERAERPALVRLAGYAPKRMARDMLRTMEPVRAAAAADPAPRS